MVAIVVRVCQAVAGKWSGNFDESRIGLSRQ